MVIAQCLYHNGYSTVLIAQYLSHSTYSTLQIAQLFFLPVCAYTANKLAQPRKKIARTHPQRPRVFPSLGEPLLLHGVLYVTSLQFVVHLLRPLKLFAIRSTAECCTTLAILREVFKNHSHGKILGKRQQGPSEIYDGSNPL